MDYQTPREVLERLQVMAEIVESEVRIQIDQKVENLRLNYALRKNDPEGKNEFTTERLEETKKEIGECEGSLAGFIREAIIHEETFHDDSEYLKTLCYNYIGEIYWSEEIQELDAELLENEDYVWQSRLGGSKKKIKEIKRFVEYMALASLYHSLLLVEGLPQERGIELKPLPANKSVLFNGKKMNLSERIKLANEFLNFTEVIDALNVQDSEKYQLMSYILGNDKDNVRNRINGTRSDKVRESEIKEYIESLKK